MDNKNDFRKKVNIWSNTLHNKTDTLLNAFGITLLLGIIVFLSVFAFSEFTLDDILIVFLLLFNLTGCIPFIEVARIKNEKSIFKKTLNISNWKNEIKKNGQYDILSSNLNIVQSIFPLFTSISFIMFFIYKIMGEKYVTYNTVLILLIMQAPFNNSFGYNPLGIAISQQNVSKHITQDDIKKYLSKNNEKLLQVDLQPQMKIFYEDSQQPMTKNNTKIIKKNNTKIIKKNNTNIDIEKILSNLKQV
jgi:hypothetical protein